jgi:hypothetical protein
MIWQDAVLAFGGFFAAVTLLPMLRAPTKPPLTTSVPLSLLLAAFAITFITLDLYLAAASTAIQCALWAAMAPPALRRAGARPGVPAGDAGVGAEEMRAA